MDYVPRSVTVTQSELQGKTTIEAAPNSEQAKVYMNLAKKVAEHETSSVPKPLEISDLRAWASTWADKLLALEEGYIAGGEKAGI
jgi:nitrogenase iron protein NifH